MQTDSHFHKRVYHRETIAGLNYEIHQMSFIPHFPSMQLKQFTLFLISANHDRVEGLNSANDKILIKGIDSLLKISFISTVLMFIINIQLLIIG